MKTKSKGFFASKINWMAILIILISLQEAIAKTDFSAMTVQTWIVFILGAAVIIVRTYFTNSKILSKSKRKNIEHAP